MAAKKKSLTKKRAKKRVESSKQAIADAQVGIRRRKVKKGSVDEAGLRLRIFINKKRNPKGVHSI